MQQGNYTNITWNGNNSFVGYVCDNNIYTMAGEQVGVNLAKYQDVEKALLKCKNRLIELGEIKVPKTPEQIIQEQSDMLEKQTQAINKLLEKVNEYEQHHQLITPADSGECQSSTATSTEYSRPDNNQDESGCTESLSEPTKQRAKSKRVDKT